ncbi:MAG TPA: N-acetylmuramoyl-L-alanine amidase [Chloroflexia bacterium]|nr:N-acetylmuramoyl-L-alanine amidase [Chloroflexia bacterium]
MVNEYAINIEQRPVSHFWKGRGGFLPIAIVEHMMQGTLEETWRYFNGKVETGEYAVSAHYGIGRDGRIWQFVADEDTAWSNGILQEPDLSIGWLKEVYQERINCNLVTLSIEYEGFSGEPLTEEQYQAALALHQQLARRWDIEADSEHIIGHDRIDSLERGDNPGSAFPLLRLLRDLMAEEPAAATPDRSVETAAPAPEFAQPTQEAEAAIPGLTAIPFEDEVLGATGEAETASEALPVESFQPEEAQTAPAFSGEQAAEEQVQAPTFEDQAMAELPEIPSFNFDEPTAQFNASLVDDTVAPPVITEAERSAEALPEDFFREQGLEAPVTEQVFSGDDLDSAFSQFTPQAPFEPEPASTEANAEPQLVEEFALPQEVGHEPQEAALPDWLNMPFESQATSQAEPAVESFNAGVNPFGTEETTQPSEESELPSWLSGTAPQAQAEEKAQPSEEHALPSWLSESPAQPPEQAETSESAGQEYPNPLPSWLEGAPLPSEEATAAPEAAEHQEVSQEHAPEINQEVVTTPAVAAESPESNAPAVEHGVESASAPEEAPASWLFDDLPEPFAAPQTAEPAQESPNQESFEIPAFNFEQSPGVNQESFELPAFNFEEAAGANQESFEIPPFNFEEPAETEAEPEVPAFQPEEREELFKEFDLGPFDTGEVAQAEEPTPDFAQAESMPEGQFKGFEVSELDRLTPFGQGETETAATESSQEPLDQLFASFNNDPGAAPEHLEQATPAEPAEAETTRQPLDELLAGFNEPEAAETPQPEAERQPLDDLLSGFNIMPEAPALEAAPAESQNHAQAEASSEPDLLYPFDLTESPSWSQVEEFNYPFELSGNEPPQAYTADNSYTYGEQPPVNPLDFEIAGSAYPFELPELEPQEEKVTPSEQAAPEAQAQPEQAAEPAAEIPSPETEPVTEHAPEPALQMPEEMPNWQESFQALNIEVASGQAEPLPEQTENLDLGLAAEPSTNAPVEASHEPAGLPDWLEAPAEVAPEVEALPETPAWSAGSATESSENALPDWLNIESAPASEASETGSATGTASVEEPQPGQFGALSANFMPEPEAAVEKPAEVALPQSFAAPAPAAPEVVAPKASAPVTAPNEGWQDDLFEDDSFFSLFNTSTSASTGKASAAPASTESLAQTAPTLPSFDTDNADWELGAEEPTTENLAFFERLMAESGATIPANQPQAAAAPAQAEQPRVEQPQVPSQAPSVETGPAPQPAAFDFGQSTYTPFNLRSEPQPQPKAGQPEPDFDFDLFSNQPVPPVPPAPPAPAPQVAPQQAASQNGDINWANLGGGVVSVELANIRTRPSYDKDTIVKVGEMGQRFAFDGWTEGPELRGSTRWYHISQASGGGWIHSSLVRLDRPANF